LVGASEVELVLEALLTGEGRVGREAYFAAVAVAERWLSGMEAALARAMAMGELIPEAELASLAEAAQVLCWSFPWAQRVLGPRTAVTGAATTLWFLLAGAARDRSALPPL